MKRIIVLFSISGTIVICNYYSFNRPPLIIRFNPEKAKKGYQTSVSLLRIMDRLTADGKAYQKTEHKPIVQKWTIDYNNNGIIKRGIES